MKSEAIARLEAQLAHARMAPDQRAAMFDEMRAKQSRLAALAATADEAQFAALVVLWMTDHYAEHVPHAQQLFAEWQKAR